MPPLTGPVEEMVHKPCRLGGSLRDEPLSGPWFIGDGCDRLVAGASKGGLPDSRPVTRPFGADAPETSERLGGGDRILVVRVGALGDTLMATPVATALRQVEPSCVVDFLCSAAGASLLKGNPSIRRVHTLRARNVPYWISPEKRRLAKRLERERYRFAVLLESAPAYRTLLEKAQMGEIRSFRENPFDPSLHSAANNLRAAGLDWRRFQLAPRLAPNDDDRATAKSLLRGLKPPWVGLHGGYGTAAKKKNQMNRLKGWSAERFAELARSLLESDVSLVLTGSRGDRREALQIAAGLPAERVRVLAGRTEVGELAAILERLRLFISVDSGPAHLAAAVGTPLIVLWGPAKLAQVRPLPHAAPVVVVRKPVPCAPCYDTPAMKSCRANICMQSIQAAEVAREAFKILGAAGDGQAAGPWELGSLSE